MAQIPSCSENGNPVLKITRATLLCLHAKLSEPQPSCYFRTRLDTQAAIQSTWVQR